MYLGIGQGFGVAPVISPAYNDIDGLKDLPEVDFKHQQQVLERNAEISLMTWLTPKTEYNTLGVLWDLFGEHKICIGYIQSHSTITQLTSVNSIIKFANKRINLALCQFIVPTPM